MNRLKILIPKGRISKKIITLLNEAGLGIETDERQYIPKVRDHPTVVTGFRSPKAREKKPTMVVIADMSTALPVVFMVILARSV